jgi:hypothetical protein
MYFGGIEKIIKDFKEFHAEIISGACTSLFGKDLFQNLHL